MPNSVDLPSLLARLRAAASTTDCLRVLIDSRDLARHSIVGFREQLEVPAVARMPRPQWWAERMGWPRGFVQEWIRRNLAGLDPALTVASIRPGALAAWALPDVLDSHERNGMGRGRLAATEFLASHGIRTGVVAAVRRESGQLGYVSWLVPASPLPLSVAESRGLVLLAEMFFDALDRVRPPEPGHRLSAIERRCLGWSAYGCTDKEIAAEMQRSMDTIRFHMKNILKKLGAANRTHAVAVAMQQGLIRLGSTPRRSRARTRLGKRKLPPPNATSSTGPVALNANHPAPRPDRPGAAKPAVAIVSSVSPRSRRTLPRRPLALTRAPT